MDRHAERGNIFSNTINLGQQKAVVLGDELFVYTSNSTAYKTSTAPDKYNWSKVNVSNLPSDVKLTSAVEYNNALYMVTESKRVFSSTNGGAWTEVTTLGDNVIVLINGFSDRLSGIVEINGKQYFNICKDGKNWETETRLTTLPLRKSRQDSLPKHIHHPDQYRQWCREGGSGRNAAGQRTRDNTLVLIGRQRLGKPG